MSAQTDVTAQYVVNPGFEDCTATTSSVNATGGHTALDYASSGWKMTSTLNASGTSWSTGAVFAYGGSAQLNGATVLHFDGVYGATYLWVNGRYVGYSQGANNDAEFDLTDFVRTGTNNISVQVVRYNDGSYLEGQDAWHMSGIHRDVYLYATPKTFVRDHVITTALDASAGYRNGSLAVAVTLGGSSAEVLLNVETRLKEATTWADAGYTMAWQQFTLQERPAALPAVAASSQLQLEETAENYTVSNQNVTMTVTKAGTVTALQIHGRNIITSDGAPTYSNFRYISHDPQNDPASGITSTTVDCQLSADQQTAAVTLTQPGTLVITTQGQVDFSLMHYDEETFATDKLHPWELTAERPVYARFDAYQRGIGDATFNLGVLDKYRCPSTALSYTLRFEIEGVAEDSA